MPVAIGFADVGVDEPHKHDQVFEDYLVSGGASTAVIDGVVIELAAGDLLVVEPGESHTFAASSGNYLHFVVQAPLTAFDKRLQQCP
ncbi:MAG: hypothetical protein JWL72_4491 [Ilumatobacteraceae bacterium]|nr:hypothetical protein [Ilumatobacteraceae bacterium]